jgi:hypothetical protein
MITEYEVGFNKMVHFVPHVAYNELEKASQFRKGLKSYIRHALRAFPLVDFQTTVEQDLGVEMQHQYTIESQKTSCVDQTRGQDARRGYTGGFQPTRRESLNTSATTPIVASPLNRVLHVGVLRGIELFLSLGWGWCVFIVVKHIVVLSVSGVADALSATRITRMWCVGGIQMGNLNGS